MEIPVTKVCKKCSIEKFTSDFYIEKRTNRVFTNCKQCCIELSKKRQQKNKDKTRAYSLKHYRKNNESYHKRSVAWHNKNLLKARELTKKSMQKGRNSLSDNYVRMRIQNNITKSTGIIIPHKDISQDFVEIQRKQLKLKRDAKKQKQDNNN